MVGIAGLVKREVEDVNSFVLLLIVDEVRTCLGVSEDLIWLELLEKVLAERKLIEEIRPVLEVDSRDVSCDVRLVLSGVVLDTSLGEAVEVVNSEVEDIRGDVVGPDSFEVSLEIWLNEVAAAVSDTGETA